MELRRNNNPAALILQGETFARPKHTKGGALKTSGYAIAIPPFSSKRGARGPIRCTALLGAFRPLQSHPSSRAIAPDGVPLFRGYIRNRFPGNLDHVLTADVHYAKAAGIDYFIFGYYLDTGSWRRDKTKAQELNRALRAYLDLPDRAGEKFALSMNWSFPPGDVEAVSEALIDAVAHPDYVRASGGKVPVFFFTPSIPAWIKGLGGDEGAARALAAIKERVQAAAGREIYAIALMLNLREDERPFPLPASGVPFIRAPSLS
ncbi:MAG TPA: hypothetical protein VFG05_02470 [Methylocella sp.]|nr:hypothetical protein [Methylocella sp.]